MESLFTAVFQKTDKWWIAFVEELPGANAQGETIDEATLLQVRRSVWNGCIIKHFANLFKWETPNLNTKEVLYVRTYLDRSESVSRRSVHQRDSYSCTPDCWHVS
jgi:hypothetical protein